MNNNFKLNGRAKQTFAGAALSIAIAFTGGLLAMPQTMHAAAIDSSNKQTTITDTQMSTTNKQTTTSAKQETAADRVIATGKQFLGVPYHFGADAGRTDMFDCSSFTQYVFGQNGIDIPRSSRQQAKTGTAVAKDDLQPGDLVFSDTNHDGVINHVSIYIGNGQLLHTYRVGVGVAISEFDGSAWDRGFVTARRVISDNDQPVVAPDEPSASNPDSDSDGQAADTGLDRQQDDSTSQDQQE